MANLYVESACFPNLTGVIESILWPFGPPLTLAIQGKVYECIGKSEKECSTVFFINYIVSVIYFRGKVVFF